MYNIGGGPNFTSSIVEAIEELERLTGKTPQVSYAQWRPSDQRIYVSDITKASKALSWEPLVAPGEGIKAMVHWLTSAPEAF